MTEETKEQRIARLLRPFYITQRVRTAYGEGHVVSIDGDAEDIVVKMGPVLKRCVPAEVSPLNPENYDPDLENFVRKIVKQELRHHEAKRRQRKEQDERSKGA
jgi:hypothetical protein